MNIFREDLIHSMIIKDAEHLERKLKEALEARLGENFDTDQLKGRLRKVCSPVIDSYYLDGELLFHYLCRELPEELLVGIDTPPTIYYTTNT